MDWSDLIAPAVTLLVFVIGAWIAVRNANNTKFSHVEMEIATMQAKLNQLSEDNRDTRELTRQIATLSAKMDALSEDVRKHNSVVERTSVLERDVKAVWSRYDEIRERVKELESYHKSK